MRDDYTDLTVILDRSGSMGQQPGLAAETISGYNNLINSQREVPGFCMVTLILFDTVDPYQVVYDHKNIRDYVFLDDKIYVPRDWTPLNDCVIQSIDEAGKRFSSLQEKDRPSKVLFFIVTDGLENSSKRYPNPEGRYRVKEKIDHQTKNYNWVFNFTGANFDVVKEAESMGIGLGSTAPMSSMRNVRNSFNIYAANATSYRKGTSKSMDYSKAQKEELMKEEND